MRLLRLFLLAGLFVLSSMIPAISGQVPGDGGRIKRGDAQNVLERYGSIPGNGVVKGDGRRIQRTHAHDIVKRYGSIPGNGIVKGDGRRIQRTHAHDIVKRYGSIPGNGIVKGDGRRIERKQTREIVDRYGSVPGGLILEGSATGLNGVRSATYDPARAALVLDGRLVYALPVPANSVATLARAIAEDDRLGVSLAEKREIVFGRLPAESEIAHDLKLADNFLGDFILPPRDWTLGYRLPDGFEPRGNIADADAAVLFRFTGFRFSRRGDKLELSGARFEARVVPILEQQAADGGYLPDLEAISDEGGFDAFESNAKHLGTNIGYYLGEKIVARALAYGETAALLRGLRAAGIDLHALARSMEGTTAIIAVRHAPVVTLEEHWMAYLKGIQAAGTYANWSSPPYDLYLRRRR